MDSFAIHRLVLTDFRNYPSLRLEMDSRPVVLTGANGVGKTNLLEAISFLSPGRGLRRAALNDPVCQTGNGEWAVSARTSGPAGDQSLGTGLIRNPANPDGAPRRAVRIDGQAEKGSAALAGKLALNWLTPLMDRLFVEGAAGRRRFLDRLVFGLDPLHAKRTSEHEKLMRQRNRLLKSGRFDAAWLSSLERQMAELAVAIAAARLDTVTRITAELDRPSPSADFPKAVLEVEGALETDIARHPALKVETDYLEKLANSRRGDALSGGTAIGVHRSDLKVRHKDKDMPAHLCSTGEQKALLISIILADSRLQAQILGSVPILLLDEITAHLDAKRRSALFDEIEHMGAQAWMTGTDYQLFSELGERAQFLTVDNGELTPTLTN